jgi:hypothetical protein
MDAVKDIKDSDTVTKPSDDQDHPLSAEENLEESLADSMDASDPPTATQPGDHGEPVPSSGFTKEDEEEAKRAGEKAKSGA